MTDALLVQDCNGTLQLRTIFDREAEVIESYSVLVESVRCHRSQAKERVTELIDHSSEQEAESGRCCVLDARGDLEQNREAEYGIVKSRGSARYR